MLNYREKVLLPDHLQFSTSHLTKKLINKKIIGMPSYCGLKHYGHELFHSSLRINVALLSYLILFLWHLNIFFNQVHCCTTLCWSSSTDRHANQRSWNLLILKLLIAASRLLFQLYELYYIYIYIYIYIYNYCQIIFRVLLNIVSIHINVVRFHSSLLFQLAITHYLQVCIYIIWRHTAKHVTRT